MDFNLTSDKKLAAVHDWHHFGNKDDVAPSSKEWKKFQGYGSQETPKSLYDHVNRGVCLIQMIINRDMVLVTDTKSMEIPKGTIGLQQFKSKLVFRKQTKRDKRNYWIV